MQRSVLILARLPASLELDFWLASLSGLLVDKLADVEDSREPTWLSATTRSSTLRSRWAGRRLNSIHLIRIVPMTGVSWRVSRRRANPHDRPIEGWAAAVAQAQCQAGLASLGRRQRVKLRSRQSLGSGGLSLQLEAGLCHDRRACLPTGEAQPLMGP